MTQFGHLYLCTLAVFAVQVVFHQLDRSCGHYMNSFINLSESIKNLHLLRLQTGDLEIQLDFKRDSFIYQKKKKDKLIYDLSG